jgi:ubiquinone/menaquinone biosynthesis C-methylase UbiE
MQSDLSVSSNGDSHRAEMDTRRRVHGMWAAVAGAWKEHADYADQRAAPITARLIALASPVPGDRVLELACGPGGLGLEVAKLVGPTGEVVLTDVAREMTDIALARARERGLTNVSGRPQDLEAIDETDGAYDVVVCREGLMFAADPAGAVREMARVLKPGGRLALSVWGERSRNPWLGLVFDAASEVLGRPVPPNGIPGPFSLGAPGRLAAVFDGSGLAGITFEDSAVDTVAPSFEDFWARTSALAGPLSKVLAGIPPAALDLMKSRLKAALAPYECADGLRIPGVALVAGGIAADERAAASRESMR